MRGLGAIVLMICTMLSLAELARGSGGARTGQIAIVYGEPQDTGLEDIARRVRQWQLMEKVQAQLNALRLPRKLTLTLKGCLGRPDAWFDEDGVTVCYEYLRVNYDAARMRGNVAPLTVSADDVLAAALFDAMLHEAAHAVLEYLAIPVLGREEDAADQLAAYQMLTRPGGEARRLILGTAFTYVEDMRVQTEQSVRQARANTDRWKYGGAHATPQQRYYNLLCLAYGKDAVLFADVVTHDILPPYRARACEDEYRQVERAWNTLIAPHQDPAQAVKAGAGPWLTPSAHKTGPQQAPRR